MRILVTGMTRMQCGDFEELPYVNLSSELVRALKKLGHQVDWRPVDVGESAQDTWYDVAIIGLSSLVSYSAHHRFGALWAAVNNPRVLYYHDDWRFPDAWSNFKIQAIDRTQSMCDYTLKQFARCSPEAVTRMKTLVNEIKSAKFPMLVGAYTFSDPTHMQALWPCSECLVWDPSPLMEPFCPPAIGAPKRRMWLCGTLSNQDKWVDKRSYSWDVYRFYKATGMPFKEQLSEQEFYRRHCLTNWGHLMYKQKILGPLAFWRPRHHLAMWAGQVAWAEPSEVRSIGASWLTPIYTIERMTDNELAELAARQRREFESHWLSPNGALGALESIVQRIFAQKESA